MADLYVEYADKEKFLDADNFYQKIDSGYLKEYDIKLAILDDLGKKRDFEEADKIYDNGFMHIFRNIS